MTITMGSGGGDNSTDLTYSLSEDIDVGSGPSKPPTSGGGSPSGDGWQKPEGWTGEPSSPAKEGWTKPKGWTGKNVGGGTTTNIDLTTMPLKEFAQEAEQYQLERTAEKSAEKLQEEGVNKKEALEFKYRRGTLSENEYYEMRQMGYQIPQWKYYQAYAKARQEGPGAFEDFKDYAKITHVTGESVSRRDWRKAKDIFLSKQEGKVTETEEGKIVPTYEGGYTEEVGRLFDMSKDAWQEGRGLEKLEEKDMLKEIEEGKVKLKERPDTATERFWAATAGFDVREGTVMKPLWERIEEAGVSLEEAERGSPFRQAARFTPWLATEYAKGFVREGGKIPRAGLKLGSILGITEPRIVQPEDEYERSPASVAGGISFWYGLSGGIGKGAKAVTSRLPSTGATTSISEILSTGETVAPTATKAVRILGKTAPALTKIGVRALPYAQTAKKVQKQRMEGKPLFQQILTGVGGIGKTEAFLKGFERGYTGKGFRRPKLRLGEKGQVPRQKQIDIGKLQELKHKAYVEGDEEAIRKLKQLGEFDAQMGFGKSGRYLKTDKGIFKPGKLRLGTQESISFGKMISRPTTQITKSEVSAVFSKPTTVFSPTKFKAQPLITPTKPVIREMGAEEKQAWGLETKEKQIESIADLMQKEKVTTELRTGFQKQKPKVKTKTKQKEAVSPKIFPKVKTEEAQKMKEKEIVAPRLALGQVFAQKAMEKQKEKLKTTPILATVQEPVTETILREEGKGIGENGEDGRKPIFEKREGEPEEREQKKKEEEETKIIERFRRFDVGDILSGLQAKRRPKKEKKKKKYKSITKQLMKGKKKRPKKPKKKQKSISEGIFEQDFTQSIFGKQEKRKKKEKEKKEQTDSGVFGGESITEGIL